MIQARSKLISIGNISKFKQSYCISVLGHLSKHSIRTGKIRSIVRTTNKTNKHNHKQKSTISKIPLSILLTTKTINFYRNGLKIQFDTNGHLCIKNHNNFDLIELPTTVLSRFI
jgi:ribosomal protein L14